MSGGMPRCARCGYLLVGKPPPQRCPECGHAVVRRERWVEGELHLEGPQVVLPIFTRTLMAALLLTAGFVVGHALNPSLLAWLEIQVQWDRRWSMLPIALAAPLACLLWTRPIESRDSGSLALDRGSAWRALLPALQLVWIAYALCVVMVIMSQPATPSTPATPTPPTAAMAGANRPMSPPDVWMAVACMLGIAAQVPWILTLRHVGRIAEYLREPTLLRIAKVWTWIWAVVVTLSQTICIDFFGLWRTGSSFSGRRNSLRILVNILEALSSGPSGTSTLEGLLVLSNIGLVIGTVLAWMLFWLMAHSLASAHETVARDQRRAERERDRYFTPD